MRPQRLKTTPNHASRQGFGKPVNGNDAGFRLTLVLEGAPVMVWVCWLKRPVPRRGDAFGIGAG